MAAKLTAFDAEYADGISLATAVATYKGIKSLQLIQDYPVLFIISPNQSVHVRAAYSATEVEINSLPTVAVGVVVVDIDNEALQLRLYRYGRALVELLMAASGARQLDGWSLATSEDWKLDTESAPFSRDADSSFIGEVGIELRANKIEATMPMLPLAYDPAVTLSADITAAAFSLNYTSTGDPIVPFDVIQIDSEKMVVAWIDQPSNTIILGRGYGGTTAAAHSAGAAILRAGAV